MIVCKNCGAEYDDKELNCPYCQYENVAEAQKQYHEELELAIKEREQLKKLPKEMEQKRTKRLVTIVTLFLLGIACIIGGIVYGVQYGPQSKFQLEKKNKEVLEHYLEEGDYKALSDYCKTLGWDGITIYEKYQEVREVYRYYDNLQGRISQMKYYFPTSDKEEQVEQVAMGMKELGRLYKWYNDYVNDTKRLANDEYLEEIWNMGKNDFIKAYMVDENLVLSVVEIEYDNDISVYNELAESVVSNMLLQFKQE